MPGLSFLSPLFLIGVAAVAVPILLHLFHRKTEVVIDFPAVRLLTRAPAQQHRRRRLRELVLLALRAAALLLLALSFARPYFAGGAAADTAPLTVIAVDTSLSMGAPGQFNQVREAVNRALSAAPASHAVALMAFADAPGVIVEPTTDRGAVRAAAAQLSPGTGSTRYRTALGRAAELIGAREARLVVITDLQQSGWEANDEGGLPDGVSVEVMAVAPPAGNLALTAAEKRDRRILASIQNYGAMPAHTSVRAALGEQELAAAEVDVTAFGAADVELSGAWPSTGLVDVSVDDRTGYQADNTRRVDLSTTPMIPVAIVVADPTGATGGLYLERALAVAGGGNEFDVEVLDGRDVARWTPGELSRQGAIFIAGTRTLDRIGRERLRDYLAQGGSVLLALGPDVDLGTLGDVIGAKLPIADQPVRDTGATMIASDNRHPVFRPFLSPSGALGDVQVDVHRRLNEQGEHSVLARFSGGDAAVVEQTVGKGRLLVFTSDLDNRWSRFPLNPAFVPFAVESARYLVKDRSRESSAAPFDARESNPAATTSEQFMTAIERTSRSSAPLAKSTGRDIENRQRWWQVGLTIMLAALAGEALVGRRTT